MKTVEKLAFLFDYTSYNLMLMSWYNVLPSEGKRLLEVTVPLTHVFAKLAEATEGRKKFLFTILYDGAPVSENDIRNIVEMVYELYEKIGDKNTERRRSINKDELINFIKKHYVEAVATQTLYRASIKNGYELVVYPPNIKPKPTTATSILQQICRKDVKTYTEKEIRQILKSYDPDRAKTITSKSDALRITEYEGKRFIEYRVYVRQQNGMLCWGDKDYPFLCNTNVDNIDDLIRTSIVPEAFLNFSTTHVGIVDVYKPVRVIKNQLQGGLTEVIIVGLIKEIHKI